MLSYHLERASPRIWGQRSLITVRRYVVRAKCVAEEQDVSFRSTLSKTMQRPGWIVEQVSFIADVWSLNEEELKKTLNSSRSPKEVLRGPQRKY